MLYRFDLFLTDKNRIHDIDIELPIINVLFSYNKYAQLCTVSYYLNHDLTGFLAYNNATVLDILPKYAVFPLISRQNHIYSNHHQNILGCNLNIISYFHSSLGGILTERNQGIITGDGVIKYSLKMI